MRISGKWVLIIPALISVNMGFLCLAYALTPAFSFEQLFPSSVQRQMGLHKLTDTEKEALRAHVERLLLISVAESLRKPAETLPARPTGGRYMGAGGGHWVQQNIDSGTYIVLEDGSLWQLDPMEKIDAMLWLPISNITVVESSAGSIGYNYLLINTDDDEKAHAKYMGNQ